MLNKTEMKGVDHEGTQFRNPPWTGSHFVSLSNCLPRGLGNHTFRL